MCLCVCVCVCVYNTYILTYTYVYIIYTEREGERERERESNRATLHSEGAGALTRFVRMHECSAGFRACRAWQVFVMQKMREQTGEFVEPRASQKFSL